MPVRTAGPAGPRSPHFWGAPACPRRRNEPCPLCPDPGPRTGPGRVNNLTNPSGERLTGLLAGRKLVCEPRDHDRYGRVVAVCYAAGKDMDAETVELGAACACRRYSLDAVEAETKAAKAGRGVWQGEAIPPETYRHASA
ncbi:thermonuclease family protein [Tropicimonas sp. IMCC34043]|uniref:thermonuclease family protein n=1 Tax=Tropicimonas sp. IMCC34043 TaxID=2248760 RepID=UPI000E21F544